ncbi:hypothetical protein [Paraburkholderia sp. J10-1]|uniref:hypothetical protein n=1 Tax=Paraburkholderia sp. J10-1 TaxID=2805430 RepID=UPI002AB66CE9|nr:hypothetical protein [Paraburkholderia sp. J10-1]
MLTQYPGSDFMRPLLEPAPKAKPAPNRRLVLDGANDDDESDAPNGATYASTDLRLKAASIVQEFAATPNDDLGDGETLSDRLQMLVVGAIDGDKDGEIDDDEAAIGEQLLDAIWDYMAAKGISDDDCDALLNDWDDDTAARVKDALVEAIPTDEADAEEDLDDFAFDDDAEQSIFDSAGEMVLDAVYKKRMVIRKGKKVKIRKRISGRVRLSAKQKLAVRKMLRKAHSARAMMRRMRSMRIRRRAGLK